MNTIVLDLPEQAHDDNSSNSATKKSEMLEHDRTSILYTFKIVGPSGREIILCPFQHLSR